MVALDGATQSVEPTQKERLVGGAIKVLAQGPLDDGALGHAARRAHAHNALRELGGNVREQAHAAAANNLFHGNRSLIDVS